MTKEVVVMSQLEGMTYAMIAGKTGLSKSKICRIITKFINEAANKA